MHINGPVTNPGNHPDPKILRRVDSAENQQTSAAQLAANSDTRDSTGHYASAPKLAELRQQLRGLADVRPDVVGAVAHRLAAGEYSGWDVSLRTAAALLDS